MINNIVKRNAKKYEPYQMMKRIFVLGIALFFLGGATIKVLSQGNENIALGKKYTFSKPPNYEQCTDPDGKMQLTDGIYTTNLYHQEGGQFWAQKTTVGWRSPNIPVYLTIDLEKIYPISGLSYNTAGGNAEVHFPDEILLFVSDDGKTWYEAGNLSELSAKKKIPPQYGKYAIHKFWTDELKTHGRFLQLVVKPKSSYVFIDEIEVTRGPDTLLQAQRPGEPITDLKCFISSRGFNHQIKVQLRCDLQAVFEDIETLDRKNKVLLSRKAETLNEKINHMPAVSPEGFIAVLPMIDLEREIFRLQAEVWRAQGKSLLRVWKTHRWDPLAPSQEPSANQITVVDIKMMNNEYRADVFNLTNADDKENVIRFRIHGLPGGINPDYITVHEALAVGAKNSTAVSAALPLAKREGTDYIVTVPSGMTRQVWISFHPKGIKAGDYKGKIAGKGDTGEKIQIPVRLQVFPLDFPDKTSLYLGGWSDTNNERFRALTPQNRDALIRHLQEHYVNAPWANGISVPPGKYDAAGNMIEKPDTTNFDAWVARWKDAKLYMVYAALDRRFSASEVKTELFEKKLANWVHFWAQHMRDLGLKPSQLGLLVLDEPHEKAQYDFITACAKIIKKAEPAILLFEDPLLLFHGQPIHEGRDSLEMMSNVDILCPYWHNWLKKPKWYRNIYLNQQKEGRELWFYDTFPTAGIDPYSYYLLRGWACYSTNAKGSAYWCFIDNNEASSWNQYAAKTGGSYCPMYLDDTSVTPAKYMEAIREGVEDYEYLVMLRDRISMLEKKGSLSEILSRAKVLLDGACERVMKGIKHNPEEFGISGTWSDPKTDRTVADRVRIEILEMLTRLLNIDS